MGSSKNAMRILIFGIALLFISPYIYSQLKQPKNATDIHSVDQFIKESFDIYDKVYKHDGYTKAAKNTLIKT